MFIHSLAAAQGIKEKRHQDVTGITIKTMLVRLGPHTQKKFSGNYPKFGLVPSKPSPAPYEA